MKSNETKYVSCIKINGFPILPPLITHGKRKEINKYKQQAVKLEKQLKREREFKHYIDAHYASNLDNHNNVLITDSLEHRLAFTYVCQNNSTNFSETVLSKNVPFTHQKKIPQLSCDLHVSQYTNNEFTEVTSFSKHKTDVTTANYLTELHNESNLSAADVCESETGKLETDNQKPRLIRSNSYTLDTPSPMLLKHLRSQSNSDDVDLEKYITSQTLDCESIYAKKDLCNISQINHNLESTSHDGYDFSSNELHYSDISRTESELKNISCLSNEISSNDATIMESPYQLKEFIDNNVPEMLNSDMVLNENINNEESLNVNSENIPNIVSDYPNFNLTASCDNQSLIKILNNIPEIYSTQIVDFLEKQKRELNLEYFLEQYKHSKGKAADSLVTSESDFCFDRSQRYHEIKDLYNKCIQMPSALENTNSKTVMNCNHELFPICGNKLKQQSREEYAASIIGAAVRGYLVRRLMHTDRVQGLIQTIKDALICAMQLHYESADTINKSDVELHRRLIQQVTAACFEFHDVFFSLSTSQQMTIIRLDREKQKEKLRQPLSRSSSINKSARSKAISFR